MKKRNEILRNAKADNFHDGKKANYISVTFDRANAQKVIEGLVKGLVDESCNRITISVMTENSHVHIKDVTREP